MARILNADEPDPRDFDLSSLECPKCGCNAVEVLQYPKGEPPRLENGKWASGSSWFGGMSGKAKCSFCNIVFPIQITNDI